MLYLMVKIYTFHFPIWSKPFQYRVCQSEVIQIRVLPAFDPCSLTIVLLLSYYCVASPLLLLCGIPGVSMPHL